MAKGLDRDVRALEQRRARQLPAWVGVTAPRDHGEAGRAVAVGDERLVVARDAVAERQPRVRARRGSAEGLDQLAEGVVGARAAPGFPHREHTSDIGAEVLGGQEFWSGSLGRRDVQHERISQQPLAASSGPTRTM